MLKFFVPVVHRASRRWSVSFFCLYLMGVAVIGLVTFKITSCPSYVATRIGGSRIDETCIPLSTPNPLTPFRDTGSSRVRQMKFVGYGYFIGTLYKSKFREVQSGCPMDVLEEITPNSQYRLRSSNCGFYVEFDVDGPMTLQDLDSWRESLATNIYWSSQTFSCASCTNSTTLLSYIGFAGTLYSLIYAFLLCIYRSRHAKKVQLDQIEISLGAATTHSASDHKPPPYSGSDAAVALSQSQYQPRSLPVSAGVPAVGMSLPAVGMSQFPSSVGAQSLAPNPLYASSLHFSSPSQSVAAVAGALPQSVRL